MITVHPWLDGPWTYRPASDPFDVPFDPPPVQNAKAWDPVMGSLHSRRSGCLQRSLRRVQPEIHPCGQKLSQGQVVIFEIDDSDVGMELLGNTHNPTNHVLASSILRMSLTGKNELK